MHKNTNLGETIITSELPDSEDYSPLPNGWYNVLIEETELKDNSKNTGQFLEIKFKVLGPQGQGRVLFSRLNLRNDNETARNIAMKEFKKILLALNISSVNDSSVLHNQELKVQVVLKPAEGQYAAGNEIKDFKATEKPAMAPSHPPHYIQQEAPQYAPSQQVQQQQPPQYSQQQYSPQLQHAQQQPPHYAQQTPPAAQATEQQPWLK